jgi:hypothetical protein
MARYLSMAAVVLSGIFAQLTLAQQEKVKYYHIVTLNSDHVLDVKDASLENDAKIIISAKGKSESQQWKMVKVGDFVKFVNRKSGKLLDVPGFSTDEGTDLIQWEDNGGTNQQWTVEAPAKDKSDKGVFIKSRSSGLVVDVAEASREDGARVIQWSYHGEKNQLWELIEVK